MPLVNLRRRDSKPKMRPQLRSRQLKLQLKRRPRQARQSAQREKVSACARMCACIHVHIVCAHALYLYNDICAFVDVVFYMRFFYCIYIHMCVHFLLLLSSSSHTVYGCSCSRRQLRWAAAAGPNETHQGYAQQGYAQQGHAQQGHAQQGQAHAPQGLRQVALTATAVSTALSSNIAIKSIYICKESAVCLPIEIILQVNLYFSHFLYNDTIHSNLLMMYKWPITCNSKS